MVFWHHGTKHGQSLNAVPLLYSVIIEYLRIFQQGISEILLLSEGTSILLALVPLGN